MKPCATAATLAAAVAAWLALPAVAAVSGTATLTLGFELVDLDPFDGIAPSITFARGADGGNRGTAQVYRPRPYLIVDNPVKSAPWTPLHSDAAIGSTRASTRATGTGTPQGVTLASDGSSVDFHGHSGDMLQYYGRMLAHGDFSLSAHTRVVLTGEAHIAARGSGPRDEMYAYSEVRFFGPDAGAGAGPQNDHDSFGYDHLASAFDFSGNAALAATFENLTNTAMSGHAEAIAQVVGRTWGNPVPEPATGATMLAGLAGLLLASTLRKASRRVDTGA